jgi:hypothetical protein
MNPLKMVNLYLRNVYTFIFIVFDLEHQESINLNGKTKHHIHGTKFDIRQHGVLSLLTNCTCTPSDT